MLTAIPSFASLVRVQDKVSAHFTLHEIGLPQPEAAVIQSAAGLARWSDFPVFVKIPIGTATSGVRKISRSCDMADAAADWDAAGLFADGGVLVQTPAEGPLVMVQAVFADGEMVASHANLRVKEGASGGASHKRSVDLPETREHLSTLGSALCWNGALSADAILTDAGPSYIDINPRLVEPGNAWTSGVDLVGAMLEVATTVDPSHQQPGLAGVATHQLVVGILGAGQIFGTRRAVMGELIAALRHDGVYSGSVEELTPVGGDWRTAIPVVATTVATLALPSAWKWFSSGATGSYALSPKGWRRIRAHGGV